MTRYEAIFCRKSIRRYEDGGVEEEILDRIRHFEEDGILLQQDLKLRWKIWKASDHVLKGMFQVKAPYYVGLYSETKGDYLLNAGCLMEQLSLYLHTKGIGSCFQGALRPRQEDERELALALVMAFGRPAEALKRGRGDFNRLELKKLARIHGTLGKAEQKLLEAARLAPSAMNLQPWRFVATEDRIHLFVKKPGAVGFQRREHWNLFDAGIALSHMLVAAEELWIDLEYQKLDSILEKEFQNYFYAGSLLVHSSHVI